MTIGNKIAAAFVKAQSVMGNATKDNKNPFFKSTYADLNSVREACLPALNENGISVLQPIVQADGKNFVKTILLHESGETIESFTEILFSKPNDPQAQGSGITYARRYGLQSLVNIGAEDDDGNKAAEKPKNVEAANVKTISADQIRELNNLILGAELTEEIFCKSLKIKEPKDLPEKDFESVKARLVKKAREVLEAKETKETKEEVKDASN